MPTPQRYQKICRVLNKRQPDLTVLMDQVNKPHNLSAILRTCDAVGIVEAHAVPSDGHTAADFQSQMYESTSGSAHKWVRVRQHTDTLATVKMLQSQGMQVLATHLSQRSVDYREIDYTKPTCVLLGAEKWGVSQTAAEAADMNIVIPMFGMVQSLNVSVAAATILFEAQGQRLKAGMYDQPQLPASQLQHLRFEWAYPDLAKEYRLAGRAYPTLTEEGEINNALKTE